MTRYKDSLWEARNELQELRVVRGELDRRIAQLEQTVLALAALCNRPEEEDLAPQGFTDVCRQILQATNQDLTPTQMRDALVKRGFDLTKYDNPLAVIHTTLQRLAKQGEATIVRRTGEDKGYRWTANDPNALEALRRTKDKKSPVLSFLNELERRRA
jgi:hypothetical protein